MAPSEIFLIDSLAGSGELIQRINTAWNWGTEKPRKLIGYPVPRQDSHAWFMITGDAAPEMFAKICGVDCRPQTRPRHAGKSPRREGTRLFRVPHGIPE